MKVFYWAMRTFLMIVGACVFTSCSDSGNDPVKEAANAVDVTDKFADVEDGIVSFDTTGLDTGLILVSPKGKVAVLGTDDSEARASERPRMTVKLDYEFAMGRHEVTCGEFNRVLLAAGSQRSLAECPLEDAPVTNVTYYDAVLFANAKSRLEGLDSAYTYRAVTFDVEGACSNLEAFMFRPEASGYRLPTEAEWIMVASEGWQPQASWNSLNSGYVPQPVCTAGGTSTFCDLEGNVMEWVNDWLGYFRDTVLADYAGALDGGSFDERVLKGGSYRNDPASMTLFERGDVYTVTSLSKSDYVGFRLARGPIPHPTWINHEGTVSDVQIISLMNELGMRAKTRVYQAKLVFRNDVTGNLAFIDYTSGTTSVVEIVDTIDAYHPEISPDGRWVAFCTGYEGVGGISTVYVRELVAGSVPVRLEAPSAAIPRWRVLPTGDTVIVYVDDAGNNADDVAFKSHSTWMVPFAGGRFGQAQKLFDGAYHGGVTPDLRRAVSGARLLRERHVDSAGIPEEGLWYSGEQACNVSLAQDGSGRTLFLDFGGAAGSAFAGYSYGVHEMLLVADSAGGLWRMVGVPAGWTFDHSEWALGSSNIAVVTLANAYGAHSKIALVNFSDREVTEIVEGEELWHPNLWLGPVNFLDSTLSLDSAGVYYNDNVWYNALELRVKMENFWFRHDEVTAVGFGSSRMMFGIYERNVTSESFLNMAFSAADMRSAYYLFKNYVLPYVKNLRTVVVEMSPDLLWFDYGTSWGAIYENVPGFKYDEAHGFWVETGPSQAFLESVVNCPKPETVLMHPYNLEDFLLPVTSWTDADVFRDTTTQRMTDSVFQENYGKFKDIVAMAHEHALNVVVIVTPVHPDYRNTGAYSVYGPRRSVAEQIMQEVQQMDVIWMDENKMGNHDYTGDMAYNMDHLGAPGAVRLTMRLDSLLATLKPVDVQQGSGL